MKKEEDDKVESQIHDEYVEYEIAVHPHTLAYHRQSKKELDLFAYYLVRILARTMDIMFGNRYGHRAVVLETIAAVPGMVGGFVNHFRSLRRITDDRGWIHTLLEEAENERMHLMVYSHIARPSTFDRTLIVLAQFAFSITFFLVYVISGRTAHRIVGYFEEEAVHSYTKYLALIDGGIQPDIKAPDIAIRYWSLDHDATIRDVIIATRADEMHHRDVNHKLADSL